MTTSSVAAMTASWCGLTWISPPSHTKCFGKVDSVRWGVGPLQPEPTVNSLFCRHHKKALRAVAFHPRYPLFASGSDDGSVIVCHGMVYR